MKHSMIKTATFAFIAAAFVTQANAKSRMERQIIHDISNQSHQAVKAESSRYEELKAKLNAKLTQLNRAADMTAFNALATEIKELAQQTKAAAQAQTFNYDEPSDNRRAELGVNYASWKLNKLISSLERASVKSDLTAAKTEIRSHI